MAAEPRRAPMMSLQQLVANYRILASEFGLPVALSAFGLTPAETERLFSSYDEDYNISRFFHFQCAAGANFTINGFPQSHVSIDGEIQSIL